MFTYTDTTVDDGLLSTSPVVDLIAAGHDSQRLERQSNARTILSAYLDGQFSYRRAHLLATTLTGVHTDNLDHAQSDAIALAREPLTDTTLRDRLDALIIELDPDKAAADREEFTNNQNIRVTKDRHGHSTLDGCIPAAQGEHHRQRITTLITQRLCEHDSRSTRQRRVAALADIQGMTTLARDCTTSQCPATAAVTTAPTPSAAVAITLTLRTGHLAHLGRYGTTDPTLADHLVPGDGDGREITPTALTYRPSRALNRRHPRHRPHLPIPLLRHTRRGLRHRPHHPLRPQRPPTRRTHHQPQPRTNLHPRPPPKTPRRLNTHHRPPPPDHLDQQPHRPTHHHHTMRSSRM
ncbi:hypothetical protein [Williamsia sterculiae]|nr:hypothetical protein [Williamsia sterculiae]